MKYKYCFFCLQLINDPSINLGGIYITWKDVNGAVEILEHRDLKSIETRIRDKLEILKTQNKEGLVIGLKADTIIEGTAICFWHIRG